MFDTLTLERPGASVPAPWVTRLDDENLAFDLTMTEMEEGWVAPSQFDLVTRLRAESMIVSHFQARIYTTIAEIAGLEGLDPEGLPAEVTVALHLTRAAGDDEYGLALLLERFGPVRDLLSQGSIDIRRARVIVESLATVPEPASDLILSRVLADAPRMTTGQLRARIRRLKLESDPAQAKKDLMSGLEGRRVVAEANPDGTADLGGLQLAPDLVMAARRRINLLARQAKTPEDERTADQRRADVFIDLLLGRDVGRGVPNAGVEILVPIETLTGLSDAPGHVPGWGPVIAEIARKVVNDQQHGAWRFTATDQGRPVATGTIGRRPSVGMKRFLQARHRTCVFPGCRMPAGDSDIDHSKPWSNGGKTALDNQAPLCRYHHRVKEKGWSYRLENEGKVVWTSPLGHTYETGRDPP